MPTAAETEAIPVSASPTTDSAAQMTAFESWGRYPKYKARVLRLNWQADFPALIAGEQDSSLPVGLGRSYGDVGLLKDGTLLQTTGMDRLLAFDAETGILTAESGISLAQI